MSEWILGWPPVTLNNTYRNIPGRGRAMVPEARAWKDASILTVRLSGITLPVGPLSLTLHTPPHRTGYRLITSYLAREPVERVPARVSWQSTFDATLHKLA